MTEKYFVIYNSDGDTYVEAIDKQALLKRLSANEAYYGKKSFMADVPDSDTNYWGEGILIIKGEVVTPKKKEIVVEYDI